MKRIIILLAALCLVLAAIPGSGAFAAEDEQLTVGDERSVAEERLSVADEQTAAEEETAQLYPIDVAENTENGVRRIVKSYELNADENPQDIPRGSFSYGGYEYTLTDVVKLKMVELETRDHKETVTISTETKELEQILPLLAPTIEFEAEDGFAGTLTLDLLSVKVGVAGTKTSSYTMTVTREYPRLSSNDTSLVPKTVTENGKTYTLASVEWLGGNTVAVDYDELAEYYTAVAAYTATGTSTKVTGYVTTAEYGGILSRITQGATIYEAHFESTETVGNGSNGANSANGTGNGVNGTNGTSGANGTDSANGAGSASSGISFDGSWLVAVALAIIGAVVAFVYFKKNKNGRIK